ncbi:unnamed protein product, partial [Ilex paraguariensis]
ELTPGGVNSPVRAFKSVGGQPIIMDSVKGCRMRDIDGNEYIDYVGSWGPAIIGHADDEVLFLVHVFTIFKLVISMNVVHLWPIMILKVRAFDNSKHV